MFTQVARGHGHARRAAWASGCTWSSAWSSCMAARWRRPATARGMGSRFTAAPAAAGRGGARGTGAYVRQRRRPVAGCGPAARTGRRRQPRCGGDAGCAARHVRPPGGPGARRRRRAGPGPCLLAARGLSRHRLARSERIRARAGHAQDRRHGAIDAGRPDRLGRANRTGSARPRPASTPISPSRPTSTTSTSCCGKLPPGQAGAAEQSALRCTGVFVTWCYCEIAFSYKSRAANQRRHLRVMPAGCAYVPTGGFVPSSHK